MTYTLRLTRDGAPVARVAIPREDYEAIRARTITTIAAEPRGPTLSIEIDTGPLGSPVYRLTIERSGKR